jgi:predicted extracellular nuclease
MDTGAPKDSAADAPDTSVVDTGVIPDAPIGCHVVINEVQTRGTTTAGDEFIELYNPCSSVIDLSGYKVIYRSASNTTDVPVATISPGKSIAVGGFFLIGNGSFSTTSDQPFTASGIADDGAAAVRDAAGTQLDSVAWGSVVSGHAFLETAAAPRPAAGGSISRVPNGTDTNNNSVDFKPTTSTPKS